MSRVVIHTASAPQEIKIGEKSTWICMCGLSKNQPLCDGSHKMSIGEEEGKLYKYENGRRIEVTS